MPSVKDEHDVFFKPIIPSCKATRGLLRRWMVAKLDKEEKELLKSFEDREWKSVSYSKREVGRIQDYATATFKKDRRFNIKISSDNLKTLQKSWSH